jgi:hypothetical protein
MIPEKLKQLIVLLTEKTNDKKAIWNKGSSENQFILSLAQGAAVSIAEWEGQWSTNYDVVIFNTSGDAIEKFGTDQQSESSDVAILAAFHKAASNQFYKVDETMDALLSSIISQDVIGTTLQPSLDAPAPDDDDLPF